MSDANDNVRNQWTGFFENVNDAFARAVEQNVEAGATLAEAWADAAEEATLDQADVADGMEGYENAIEVWAEAAEEMAERSMDAAEGEDIAPTEFRDIWLQSANEAFKEVMSTSAFAAANGEFMEAMTDLQEGADEMGEDALERMGMPTGRDIEEVGERLIELERRQHRVEEKLDRVLEELDT